MKKVMSILLALVIIAFSSVPAFAAIYSPDGKFRYKVTIVPTEGGTGSYYFSTAIDPETAEQGVHLTPIAYDGYIFDHWEIKGAFQAGEQSFTVIHLGSAAISNPIAAAPRIFDNAYGEMDIAISSDIYAYPYYVKKAVAETTAPAKEETKPAATKPTQAPQPATAIAKTDTGSVSPKTGTNDFVMYTIVTLSVLTCAAVATVLVKASRKSK